MNETQRINLYNNLLQNLIEVQQAQDAHERRLTELRELERIRDINIELDRERRIHENDFFFFSVGVYELVQNHDLSEIIKNKLFGEDTPEEKKQEKIRNNVINTIEENYSKFDKQMDIADNFENLSSMNDLANIGDMASIGLDSVAPGIGLVVSALAKLEGPSKPDLSIEKQILENNTPKINRGGLYNMPLIPPEDKDLSPNNKT